MQLIAASVIQNSAKMISYKTQGIYSNRNHILLAFIATVKSCQCMGFSDFCAKYTTQSSVNQKHCHKLTTT